MIIVCRVHMLVAPGDILRSTYKINAELLSHHNTAYAVGCMQRMV